MGGDIEALGYLGLEVSDLVAWTDFATQVLGLQAVPRDDGTLDLRMDGYATRIRLHQGPRDDLAYAGWEVKDEAALDRLAARRRIAGSRRSSALPTPKVTAMRRSSARFSRPTGPLSARWGWRSRPGDRGWDIWCWPAATSPR